MYSSAVKAYAAIGGVCLAMCFFCRSRASSILSLVPLDTDVYFEVSIRFYFLELKLLPTKKSCNFKSTISDKFALPRSIRNHTGLGVDLSLDKELCLQVAFCWVCVE